MTHLASLSDEELLSEFRCKRDPLVTTPMEEELAERLCDNCDLADADEKASTALSGLDPSDAKAICSAVYDSALEIEVIVECIALLEAAGIEAASDLKDLLDAAATISNLNIEYTT